MGVVKQGLVGAMGATALLLVGCAAPATKMPVEPTPTAAIELPVTRPATTQVVDNGETVTGSVTNGWMRMTLTAPKQMISGKENVVEVVVRNEGEQPIRFSEMHGNVLRGLSFHVRTELGPAHPNIWYRSRDPDESQSGSFITDVLPPGKEIHVVVNLTRLFDLSVLGRYFIDAGWIGSVTTPEVCVVCNEEALTPMNKAATQFGTLH